jgi:hypothetical protein
MRIAIQADDGDEVSISADFVSVEQALVTLEIENALYEGTEFDSVTLTIDKARELARALICVADSLEYVRSPIFPFDLTSAASDKLVSCRALPVSDAS